MIVLSRLIGTYSPLFRRWWRAGRAYNISSRKPLTVRGGGLPPQLPQPRPHLLTVRASAHGYLAKPSARVKYGFRGCGRGAWRPASPAWLVPGSGGRWQGRRLFRYSISEPIRSDPIRSVAFSVPAWLFPRPSVRLFREITSPGIKYRDLSKWALANQV